MTTLPNSSRQFETPTDSTESSRRSHAPVSAFILDPESHPLIYGESEVREIGQLTKLSPQVIPFQRWQEHRETLKNVEFIFSGWSAPLMDTQFLNAAPRLKAVFYGAGSIRYFVTDEMWKRGIRVTSAASANAIPVAEYTLGVILLSLRQFWSKSAAAKKGEGWGDHTRPIPGSYRATIGLLSFGAIGRRVAQLLKPFDFSILVHCPFLSEQDARTWGVQKCSLPQLFKLSDVISIHTPVLPQTVGLVNGALISSMKTSSTLINTARGVIINQPELVETLRKRTDIHAILDVTDPEPPTSEDPVLQQPNITVTSHIAGSHGRDCQRMGSYMVKELKNYLSGQPLEWELTKDIVENMA